MKRTISLLLALVLTLSLCACGGSNETSAPEEVQAPETMEETAPEVVLLTKDEILADAVEIGDYAAEFISNKLRAEETFIGKNFLVTGTVAEIQREYIVLTPFNNSGVGTMTVEMPTEEIMNLTTGQRIQIVGKFDSYAEEEVDFGYGFTETAFNPLMTNGYLVKDVFEIRGIFRMYYMSLRDINGKTHMQWGEESAWSIGLDLSDDNVISVEFSMKDQIPVEHVPGQDITSIEFCGFEIHDQDWVTVSAKVIGTNLKEAEVIAVG